jgi:hypothetical protein
MRVTYKYTEFNGDTFTGECTVHECNEGFYATGVVGPQGCSKTQSPVVHWKPIKAAIADLLGGRVLHSYSVVSV